MTNKVRSIARAINRKAEQDAASEGLKVTLGQLLQFQTPGNPLDLLIRYPIPIKTSYRLSKIAKAVDSELDEYQAALKTLLERYANKDAEGKIVILGDDGKRVTEGSGQPDIPADKKADVQREHGELLTTEVTIPGKQIAINELGDIQMSAANLLSLDWLLIGE